MTKLEFRKLRKSWKATTGNKGLMIMIADSSESKGLIVLKGYFTKEKPLSSIEPENAVYKFNVDEVFPECGDMFSKEITSANYSVILTPESYSDLQENLDSMVQLMLELSASIISDSMLVPGFFKSLKSAIYCTMKIYTIPEKIVDPDYTENADITLNKENIPKLQQQWKDSISNTKGAIIYQFDQKSEIGYLTVAHFGYGNENSNVTDLKFVEPDEDGPDDYIFIDVFILNSNKSEFVKLKDSFIMIDSTRDNCHTCLETFCFDVIDETGFTNMADYRVLQLFNA